MIQPKQEQKRLRIFGELARTAWDKTQEDPVSENSRGDMRGEDKGQSLASGCSPVKKDAKTLTRDDKKIYHNIDLGRDCNFLHFLR